MKKSIIAAGIVLAAWLTPVCTTNAQTETKEKKPVEKAFEGSLPNLTLTDMNGKQVNVADLGKTGKITVLDFWATWCVPCKKELNNINDVYDDWKKKYNVYNHSFNF